ncbi:MAG: glycoside hydrolase family 3 C-terminal domain-containing protein [Candidatus Izemoplasmatales bacterium]|nr:glycoside hydrolase family 3 C-terminal domain-containing protein [Candidatus Izemoplasmatales bacterium]
MVLLKNNDILPLKKAEKLLLVGSFAASPRIGGGGSSDLMPFQIDLPLETIRARADVTLVDTYDVPNETLTQLVNFDHVLVFTGTTAKIESEGFDRRRIDLPLEQIECVKQISAIRNDVIVVNASGSAVALDGWTDGVGAILQTWFSGSAGGEAIARVLFGEVNPSGRLSETFPKRLENTPVYPGFPGNGDIVHYQEGLFTGYRFYDTHQIAVTYPFGYGLSYTNFVWSSPRFNTTYLKKTDTLECLVDVENTGPVAGIETVMIFVSMPKVGFVHPHKILRGFSQISLSPGEKQTVRVWIPVTDLSVYVDEVGQFMVEQGTYEIHFAKNVAEVAFSSTIQIASDDVCHQPKAMWQPANVWLLADPEKSMIHDLEEHYRILHWWEKEEPLERILNRIASEWKMTVEEAAALKAPYLAIRPQQA